jgi:hypothetical protein
MKYNITMKSGRQYDVLATSVSEVFNKVELLERKTNDVAYVLAQVSFTLRSVAGSGAFLLNEKRNYV